MLRVSHVSSEFDANARGILRAREIQSRLAIFYHRRLSKPHYNASVGYGDELKVSFFHIKITLKDMSVNGHFDV